MGSSERPLVVDTSVHRHPLVTHTSAHRAGELEETKRPGQIWEACFHDDDPFTYIYMLLKRKNAKMWRAIRLQMLTKENLAGGEAEVMETSLRRRIA
jgi:hypothetical protein